MLYKDYMQLQQKVRIDLKMFFDRKEIYPWKDVFLFILHIKEGVLNYQSHHFSVSNSL